MLFDKNKKPLQPGSLIFLHKNRSDDSFSAEKSGFGSREYAKLIDFNEETGICQIQLWNEMESKFFTSSIPFNSTRLEDSNCTATCEENGYRFSAELITEESIENSPLYWNVGLSVILKNLIHENEMEFTYERDDISTQAVADTKGFLPAFVHQMLCDEFLTRIISPEMSTENLKSFVKYTESKSPYLGMEIGFLPSKSVSFYKIAHLFFDSAQKTLINAKMDPENLIDGKIQIENICRPLQMDIKNKRVVIEPLRTLVNTPQTTKYI